MRTTFVSITLMAITLTNSSGASNSPDVNTGQALGEAVSADALVEPVMVQPANGYNAWPMIQVLGGKLVCVYSRGTAHTTTENDRAVYARTSMDDGKTWTEETLVVSTPGYGDVAIGKGLDDTGAMFLWVRRMNASETLHDLYRSKDGVTFTFVTTPKLAVTPVQITDIFEVPSVGLMALWFAGNYNDKGPGHSWGTLVSSDNGATWNQTAIESGLTLAEWPTEPSAVYLGDGKILAVGRTERGKSFAQRSQYQMVSTDYGATWRREQTNIQDIHHSTPSLILDSKTGLLSNYYYQRGQGILWRRIVDPANVFDHPLNWPASETVTLGSQSTFDAGNVNATSARGTHYIAYYSGKAPDTGILVAVLPAPTSASPVGGTSTP